jgi:hypothetical protein
MTEIQNSKPLFDLEEEKPNLFMSLDIGIWNLFVTWRLEFEIYKEDQVFQD